MVGARKGRLRSLGAFRASRCWRWRQHPAPHITPHCPPRAVPQACSRCVARLRFVLEDKRCMYCHAPQEVVFFTRYMGDYTARPESFDVLQVGGRRTARAPPVVGADLVGSAPHAHSIAAVHALSAAGARGLPGNGQGQGAEALAHPCVRTRRIQR